MMKRRLQFLNNRIFRRRNIIIVSDGEIKHYPIESKVQIMGLALAVTFLCSISYFTGHYISTRHTLKEKERAIASSNLNNQRMGEQYNLLKRDMAKLSGKTDEEISNYERFIMSQYDGSATQGNSTDGKDAMQARIEYLENTVTQLKSDRALLVSSIRERTKDQIAAYEDLIESTGLNLARLAKSPQAKERLAKLEKQNTDTADGNYLADKSKTGKDKFANQGGPFEPDNVSQLSANEIREQNAMFSSLNTALVLGDIMHVIPFAAPVQNAEITSRFGRRVDPINKRWAIHKGMDFDAQYGAKVNATSDGKVIVADSMRGYGRVVEIDHGYGITTRYAHLDRILVREGQTVKKGTPIGTQGNSGRSTGSHVHYEIRYNKTALNPEKFVKAGDDHVF